MKRLVDRADRILLGVLRVALCLALGAGAAAPAQEITEKTLVDRQQIEDLITRYYNNFGRENAENFADFYAEDAELILGTRSYKGRDGIMQAYGRGPAPVQDTHVSAHAATRRSHRLEIE